MSVVESALPRAVTVHGVVQARLALAVAELIGRPVLLLSGPGAGGYAGALWWRGVVDAALEGRPIGPGWVDALDCGDQAGRALEALAAGCGIVVLAPCPGFTAVVERAGGALVVGARPTSLDLAVRGAERLLPGWLGG